MSLLNVGGVAEGLGDGEGDAVGDGETVAVGVGVCATAVAESRPNAAIVRSADALRENTDRVILVLKSWKSGPAHASDSTS